MSSRAVQRALRQLYIGNSNRTYARAFGVVTSEEAVPSQAVAILKNSSWLLDGAVNVEVSDSVDLQACVDAFANAAALPVSELAIKLERQKDDGLTAQMLLALAAACTEVRVVSVFGAALLGPAAAAAVARFCPQQRLEVLLAVPLGDLVSPLVERSKPLQELVLSLHGPTERALRQLGELACCELLTLLPGKDAVADWTPFFSGLALNTTLAELDVGRFEAPLVQLFSAVAHSKLRALTAGVAHDWSGLLIAADCTTLHTLRLHNVVRRPLNQPVDFGRLDALFGVDLYAEFDLFPPHYDDDDDGNDFDD